MLRKIFADLRSAAGFAAGVKQLPAAIHRSLNPTTRTEALIVGSQLDLVRASLKLFDYALPFAGAIVVLFDRFHSKAMLGAWWAVLALTCVGNEVFLNRHSRASTDPIADVRIRARHKVIVCMFLTLVWTSVAIWLWAPGNPGNQMFVDLILCCTLAALATMASLHAASVAGPIALVSAAVIAVPIVKDAALHPILVGLSIVYVVLMVSHACMIQMRTLRLLQLENERTELIENLRNAKMESDLAHEQAVAASRAKSEFLANMSHELRTPLNAIIGFSDIVRSRTFGDTSEKYSEYGGFIHQSGQNLLNVIDDILDLAKIDAGKKVLLHAQIDLRNVISDAMTRVNEAAHAKDLNLVAVLPETLPLLRADPRASRQILDNLLSNAVRFTQAGGRIEASAAMNSTGELALSVSDTGIGIAPEDQTHIFERLGHRQPEITAEDRGSGLGLAIVKGLVEMHGARIELQSTPGEGTRVTVYFPTTRIIKESDARAA